MSAIVGEVTGDDVRRTQMRAWYSDPVRNLPRKVVTDVLWLLDAIDEQRERIADLRIGNECGGSEACTKPGHSMCWRHALEEAYARASAAEQRVETLWAALEKRGVSREVHE